MRFAFVFLILLFAAPAFAASDLVQAKLIADVSAVEPGKPFTLGVLLTIKPGWHIYWKNPGEAGLPTRVKFNLPEGFQVGELKYPVPSRITDVGGISMIGYESQVLLTATVSPPDVLEVGESITCEASADWLCCKVDCVPGKAALKLELPIAATTTPDNSDIFKQWQARLPVKDDSVKVSGSLDLSAADASVTLAPSAPGELDCIPDAVDGINITVQPVEGGRKFQLKATKLQGQTVTAKSVEVLITHLNGEHNRVGVSVDVPIVNAAAK